MSGGRKIIAIEGGAEDAAANKAAVPMGKRLAGEALAGLLALELDGLCEQRPGQRFVRRGP